MKSGHIISSLSVFVHPTVHFWVFWITQLYYNYFQLDALEFLHEHEYVHADIKSSNLLTGLGSQGHCVYLVDYGLASRYCPEGKHREYKKDPRRAHDGTLEFTSIDAHDGVSKSLAQVLLLTRTRH